MKKRIITVITAALCMQSVAFAETTADCVNTNGKITVTGKTVADTTVTLTVADSENADDFYAFKETVSDENGNFSFDFKLRAPLVREDVSTYVLRIKGDSLYTKNISVFSDAVKDSVIAEVTGGDKDMLQALLSDNDKCIVLENQGFDIVGYNSLSTEEKQSVAENYYTDKAGYADIDASLLFNAEIAVVVSKTATDLYNEVLKNVDNVGIEFSAASDFVKNGLKDDKSYTNLSEFKEKFDELAAVEKINDARFSDMEELFEKNKIALGLDGKTTYNTYLAWNEIYKRNVNQKIVTALTNNPANNKTEFLTAFDRAVAEVTSSMSYIGSGSGGSSGGSDGGSKGSSAFPGGAGSTQNVTSVQIPEKVIEKIEFSDIDYDFWAKSAIETLAKDKIINGYDDGSFKPNNYITREEFVCLVAKAFKIESGGLNCSFEDVKKDKWYYDYVASCCEHGIVSGLSDTEFGVGRNITRQDAAVIVSRILDISSEASEKFKDDSEISDYAKSAVYLLKNSGIVSGDTDNNFNPKSNLTRAECAVIVEKAMQQ